MRLDITHIKVVALALLIAVLGGCGTVNKFSGPDEGDSSETEARNVRPDDPLARPTQLGWTSARATRCGFIFNPQQLRSNYLSTEAAYNSPKQMKKIQDAYDYTHESILTSINDDPVYCNKERLDAIRADLNRYLTGDYRPSARLAR